MKTNVASIAVPPARINRLNSRLVRSYGIPDISMPIGSRTTVFGTYSWSTPTRIYQVEFERDILSGATKSFLTIASR